MDLDVRCLASPLGYVRVGVIVPRHGRSAVERNRLKRRLRELVRRLLVPISASYDVVIHCRPGAYGKTFDELNVQLTRIQTKLMEMRSDQSERCDES